MKDEHKLAIAFAAQKFAHDLAESIVKCGGVDSVDNLFMMVAVVDGSTDARGCGSIVCHGLSEQGTRNVELLLPLVLQQSRERIGEIKRRLEAKANEAIKRASAPSGGV